MDFHVKDIVADAMAQLGCGVRDGNDDAIAADSMVERKPV
jgi:hypothetical protein